MIAFNNSWGVCTLDRNKIITNLHENITFICWFKRSLVEIPYDYSGMFGAEVTNTHLQNYICSMLLASLQATQNKWKRINDLNIKYERTTRFAARDVVIVNFSILRRSQATAEVGICNSNSINATYVWWLIMYDESCTRVDFWFKCTVSAGILSS